MFSFLRIQHTTVMLRLQLSQETVQKLLDAARSGGFQAVQQAVSDLIAEGWLVRTCCPPCSWHCKPDAGFSAPLCCTHCEYCQDMPVLDAGLPVSAAQMQSVLLEVQSAVLSDDTLRDEQRAKACSAVALADKVRWCVCGT